MSRRPTKTRYTKTPSKATKIIKIQTERAKEKEIYKGRDGRRLVDVFGA
jgi:hypothetical protein